MKVLGRFSLQNFHNELSLPIFRFPATFHTYKPSINLSSQNTNDHNYNYNPMPRTTHTPINQRPLLQQLNSSNNNQSANDHNFSTMPRTPHAPINQRPPQLQLNSSDQPTTTTATATRCRGPHTHQSTNDHRNCTYNYNYNTMPRLSHRNGKVGRLYAKWMDLRQQRRRNTALTGDDDIFDVLLEQDAKKKFRIEERSRYSADSRAYYRRGAVSAIFTEDLDLESGWLNDAEFKDKYRMTRSSFWLIVDLIKDHAVFRSKWRRQAPVKHQLMTLLCFLGTEGNGMSDRRGRSVF